MMIIPLSRAAMRTGGADGWVSDPNIPWWHNFIPTWDGGPSTLAQNEASRIDRPSQALADMDATVLYQRQLGAACTADLATYNALECARLMGKPPTLSSDIVAEHYSRDTTRAEGCGLDALCLLGARNPAGEWAPAFLTGAKVAGIVVAGIGLLLAVNLVSGIVRAVKG